MAEVGTRGSQLICLRDICESVTRKVHKRSTYKNDNFTDPKYLFIIN